MKPNKYTNLVLLDTPEFRLNVTIIAKKKIAEKDEEIELVYFTKESLAITSAIYTVFAFKTNEGYSNIFLNYAQLRNVKAIARKIADLISDDNGSLISVTSESRFKTAVMQTNQSTIEFYVNSSGVTITAIDESGVRSERAELSFGQFLGMTEILEQINLPSLHMAAGISFAEASDDDKYDNHTSPRLRKREE